MSTVSLSGFRERENNHIVLLGSRLLSDDNRSSTDGRRSEARCTTSRCRRTSPNIFHKNQVTNKNSNDLQVLPEKSWEGDSEPKWK